MWRTFALAGVFASAVAATIATAFAGQVALWVFYVWVWVAVTWAFNWWFASRQADR